jgi:hypothetical protein
VSDASGGVEGVDERVGVVLGARREYADFERVADAGDELAGEGAEVESQPRHFLAGLVEVADFELVTLVGWSGREQSLVQVQQQQFLLREPSNQGPFYGRQSRQLEPEGFHCIGLKLLRLKAPLLE